MARFLYITLSFGGLALTACAYTPTRAPASLKELRSRGAVLQNHEYTCGAAALATLMRMFGHEATETQVLTSIFGQKMPLVVGKDGQRQLRALTVADLEAGAEKAGFKVVSIMVKDKRDLGNALQSLQPAITRMNIYGQLLHFVVVRRIEDGWVHVSDPGYGHFKMPARDFYETWDAGDKILLTVGRRPFLAWKTRDSIYLKRDEKDRPAAEQDASLSPLPLYGSVHRRLAALR